MRKTRLNSRRARQPRSPGRCTTTNLARLEIGLRHRKTSRSYVNQWKRKRPTDHFCCWPRPGTGLLVVEVRKVFARLPGKLVVSGISEIDAGWTFAFPSSRGKLIELNVREGDQVKKGAVIARNRVRASFRLRRSADRRGPSIARKIAISQLVTFHRIPEGDHRDRCCGPGARSWRQAKGAARGIAWPVAASRKCSRRRARLSDARAGARIGRSAKWDRYQVLYRTKIFHLAIRSGRETNFDRRRTPCLRQAEDRLSMVQEGAQGGGDRRAAGPPSRAAEAAVRNCRSES